MINKIGVENFRVFKEYTEFEVRPITLLTGPNNSGKSSLTKLLLLIQGNIESLNFQKGFHNLESFDKIKSWNGNKQFIKVRLGKASPFFGDNFDTTLTYNRSKITGIELGNNTEKLFSIELSETVPTIQGNKLLPENYAKVYLNTKLYIDFIFSKNFQVLAENPSKNTVEHLTFAKVKLLKDKTVNLIGLNATTDKQNRSLAEVYNIRNEALNNGLNERIAKNDRSLYIGWIPFREKGQTIIDPDKLIINVQKVFDHIEVPVKINPEGGLTSNLILEILEKTRRKALQEITNLYTEEYPSIEIEENILGRMIFDQKLFNTSRDFRLDFQNTMFEEFRHIIRPLNYHLGYCHYISPQRGKQKRILMNQSDNDIDQIVYEYSNLE